MKISIELDADEAAEFHGIPEQLREVLFKREMLRYQVTQAEDSNTATLIALRRDVEGITQTRGLLG